MALVLESNVTPPVPLLNGDGGPLLAWMQPTVRGDVGGLPVHWAPHGAASGLGSVVFYGVLALAAIGAWSLLRGLKGR